MWPGEEVADVLCVGKALGGGLPLSAALFYRDGLEEVWQLGPEDVYTHTHVGNPLACAAALVVLEEVPKLLDRVREAGERFERAGWHGRGLLRAREGDADEALARGVLVVPAGLDGSLIQATPPLTITDAELDEALANGCPDGTWPVPATGRVCSGQPRALDQAEMSSLAMSSVEHVRCQAPDVALRDRLGARRA